MKDMLSWEIYICGVKILMKHGIAYLFDEKAYLALGYANDGNSCGKNI